MKVILYVLDSLRADHLSCYRYSKKTSPNIDALAAEGVIFENAFSASTWTRPSASSILTGLYPLRHGVETFHSTLSKKLPKITTILQSENYTCAAFSTIVQVSKNFGFDHGFEEFYELFRDGNDLHDEAGTGETKGLLPSSEDLNTALFPWLEKHAKEDFFVLAWSIDTHVPYRVAVEKAQFVDKYFKTREMEIDYKANTYTPDELKYIKQLYESCIYYNDQQIGKLCAFLKEMEIYDDCLIIVIGDHGEVFNEHLDPKNNLGQRVSSVKDFFSAPKNGTSGFYGRRGHIIVPPYDEDIHVPLICKFPGNEFGGKRVSHLASLVDVTPTILNFVGGNAALKQSNFDGKTLIPYLNKASQPNPDEVVYCSGKSYPSCPAYYCIRNHDWKYILTEPPGASFRHFLKDKLNYSIGYLRHRFLLANEVLYNLKTGSEDQNVLESHPEIAEMFRRKMADWRNRCENRQQEPVFQVTELDEINERQLRALGYTN